MSTLEERLAAYPGDKEPARMVAPGVFFLGDVLRIDTNVWQHAAYVTHNHVGDACDDNGRREYWELRRRDV